jgi:O-acetyl-ADP-ribose deacetylase
MAENLTYKIGSGTLSLMQGDLTLQETDAIVNAANPTLMGGGGVDGAIHRAGGPAILEACKAIVAERGELKTGQAVITTGGRLKARYVIHTVGPIYSGKIQDSALLASAYRESLKVAAEHNLKSVAFPSISTGAYSYPLGPAAGIALREVKAFLSKPSTVKEVVIVLYGEANYRAYAEAAGEVLEENYKS